MKRFSKFFTPSLTQTERRKIADLIGLAGVRYLHHEQMAGQGIFSHAYHGDHLAVAALQEEGLKSWLHEASLDFIVIIEQKSQGGRLPAVPALCFAEGASLWESLFPFPLSLLRFAAESSLPFSTRIMPEPLQTVFDEIGKDLNELESKLSHWEVALLWIESGSERFPLLLHFVRRKLVRIGTLPRLNELGHKYELGQLSQEQFEQAMGTRSIFIPFTVLHQPGISMLEALSETVCRALLHFVDYPENLIPPPSVKVASDTLFQPI